MAMKSLPCVYSAGVLAGWLGVLATPAVAADAAAAATDVYQFPATARIVRADRLLGRLVETRDGEELGRVRDIALDLTSGRIGYVVIRVGNFRIDDGLMAVDPRALRETAGGDGRLVLDADADNLRDAQRFGGAEWPLRADIVGATVPTEMPAPAAADTATTQGTAVISDGTRTATLSAGELTIRTVANDD
jgi:sporulation protein YlmC with PRC-barrel domain